MDEKCVNCGQVIRAFDGGVWGPDASRDGAVTRRHGDLPGACEKAAAKDYARIASLFNSAGYEMSRTLWGPYMHATHGLDEKKRTELDKIVLPALHALDAALKEAWQA